MNLGLRKIDAIIVAALIVISGLFLYQSGYISNPPIITPQPPPPPPENVTPSLPVPPNSFIPSYRRDVSPDDEGVHFDKLSVEREWWSFGAVFNDTTSGLQNWSFVVSFDHMALGDFFGTRKPDLLVVCLFGKNGESYGGMINKKRYPLGILNTGTLIASSPGVSVQFEDSWAEGRYPDWHLHAEDNDIDKNHEIIIDLDYHAFSLPIWTLGTRAFEKSKSSIANYLIMGCDVSGTVIVDGKQYHVQGTGYHEHSWSSPAITKAVLNGWDRFYLLLENGWELYTTNYYNTPQAISTKTPNINPFGSLLLTTDNGQTFTELMDVNIQITRTENQVIPFVKLPLDFNIFAKPSLDPIHLISQSLLFGTNTELEVNIGMQNSINKIWKFPTYVGMKLGSCNLDGTMSWSDDEGDHQQSLNGVGVSWNMRAFL